MGVKKILWTFCLFAVLLVGYWYFEQLDAEDQSLQAVSESLIDNLSVSDVYKVHLIAPGKSFAVYRDGYGIGADGETISTPSPEAPWLLHDPEGAPTIPSSVDTFLQHLSAVMLKNSVKAELVSSNQSVYGLKPPERVLKIKTANKEIVLSFGKKHEISGRRYVQKESDPRILLIDEEDFEQINIGKDDIRSRQPLQFDVSKVTTVTILRRESTVPFSLRKVSDSPSRWTLDAAGIKVDADTELIESELKKLSEVEVDRFLLPTIAPLHYFGLDDPLLVLRVALADEGGEEKEILLQFAEAGEITVRLPKQASESTVGLYFFRVSFQTWIYQLTHPSFRGWIQEPTHFRNTLPFSSLREENVSQVVLRSETQVLTFSTDEKSKEWRLGVADGQEAGGLETGKIRPGKINRESFRSWFNELTKTKVLSYPSLKPADKARAKFDSPVFSVSIEQFENEPALSLIVGGPLKAANAQDGDSADPLAPRYGLLRGADKRQVAVVLSASVIEDLRRTPEYFSNSTKTQR